MGSISAEFLIVWAIFSSHLATLMSRLSKSILACASEEKVRTLFGNRRKISNWPDWYLLAECKISVFLKYSLVCLQLGMVQRVGWTRLVLPSVFAPLDRQLTIKAVVNPSDRCGISSSSSSLWGPLGHGNDHTDNRSKTIRELDLEVIEPNTAERDSMVERR